MHVLVRNNRQSAAYRSRVGLFENLDDIQTRINQLDSEQVKFHNEVMVSDQPSLLSPTFLERANQEFNDWKAFFDSEESDGGHSGDFGGGFFSHGVDKPAIDSKNKVFKKKLGDLSTEWFVARAKSPPPPAGSPAPRDPTPVDGKFPAPTPESDKTSLAERNKQNRTIILVGIVTTGVVVTAITITRAIKS